MMNQFYLAFTKINSILINPLSSHKKSTKRKTAVEIFPSRRKGKVLKKILTHDQTILAYFQVKMEATSYTTMLSMWGSIPTRALKMGKTTMLLSSC